MHNDKQTATAAAEFAKRWQGRGYEKGDTQSFWIELLAEVFGIENPSTFIRFEEQVKVGSTKFIDASINATKTLIEQKSLGKDLRKGIVQSDGSLLTPFQQAKRYAAELPYSERPRWIVTCNFAEFLVYDMERPNCEPERILLESLEKEYYRLQFLVDVKSEHLSKEMQVSMAAGEIVGKLYDELLKQYIDPTNAQSLQSLNVLCVRLVFCLYAEDAGIFGRRDQFHDYLARYTAEEMREALIALFRVLDTPVAERDPYLREDLLAFPYTNGGLFADKDIEIPRMTEGIRQLLQNASLDFDWSEISPTIFGAVFESTLNPVTRRTGGMHYTSIENIHKVIDPLFLDDLRQEFEAILAEKGERNRNRKLDAFQDKLASLTFLDPACGSGNFLTETYLSLRRLENEVIRERHHGQSFIGFENITPIKVSINQFHGIEINDFAVTVATTALWISEAQMLAETERIISHDIDFLPLKSYANIREGNALRMDWDIVEVPDDTVTIHAKNTYLTLEEQPQNLVCEPEITYGSINLTTSKIHPGPKPEPEPICVRYDYIIGNPPFVGARMMSKEQKTDLISVFGKKWPGVGDLDYVSCWFKKAANLIVGVDTKVALVSTNSITQGAAVANLWKPLFEQGVHIDFAHRTFRWDSESSLKAHVHCVIVGFSVSGGHTPPQTSSPSKLEGVAQRAGGVCDATTDTKIPRTKNLAEMKSYRRELRTDGTKAEATLWKAIKGKQIDGLQFRRQYSVDGHILDFYCPSIKLAIELDGDYHFHLNQPTADFSRDMELFREHGIKTLRFENCTVFEQQYIIISAIKRAKAEFEADGHTPPSLRDTSPNLGEDQGKRPCIIFDGDRQIQAAHINAYLLDAPHVFVEKRMHPLCDVPEICLGGQPIDDGNLIFSKTEKEFLQENHPEIAPTVRKFMMGKDFIERTPRYCLWLQGVSPALWRKIPEIHDRVTRVREFRLRSKRVFTLKAAQSPMLFGAPFECLTDYIAIPKVSSENRRYIPIDFLSKDIIPGDKLFCLQDATLYHFGVLPSNVPRACTRAVCGRLKSDYSYSNTIVYNNFPWPEVADAQRAKIEKTAQGILDARALYPDSSLADLYDEVTMPPELRRAHQENDRAVMEAYGFDWRTMTESQCVTELFKLYQNLTQQVNNNKI